jgi:DNA gyrase subunit A
VLFAMHELSNDWNRPYKKSARIVGDVIGKYHPHGDSAVYDTIVRMAQPFSLRYPLVDGQGNFGSVDGDNAAAMRYTEIRMSRIAHELLADIDKETVEFGPYYEGSEQEPLILPARVPNLLVNGSSGIAVGMATNIPPHNLREVVAACRALLEDPSLDIDGLMAHLPAPDFPTGGIIHGVAGIREAYRTGRGRVVIRARTHFEDIDRGQRQAIVIDELPYQVNKAHLLSRIGELVREKRLEGISEIRDESDKSGMRAVIELKRGENAEVVLNNLFKETQLQDSFGVNMVALVDGQPRLLDLRQMLQAFLRHRREVVVRRSVYDLRRARERGHVLEGLAVAMSNIDEVIALIKAAASPADAKAALMGRAWRSPVVEAMLARAGAGAALSRPDELDAALGLHADGYRLSEVQAQAILDMRLQRLTALEQDRITGEYQEVMERIADLLDILARPDRVTRIIGDELSALAAQYGDARRSEVVQSAGDVNIEDLITPENVVVTLSHGGYMKSQPVADYQAQRRGGRGRQAAGVKDDDFIEKLFVAHSHDYVLCFSSRGRVYWIKVYNVPQGGRASRGRPIVNLLPLAEGEKINAILPVHTFDDHRYVVMATADGTVKKTPLSEFSRPRASGIIAVDLDPDDYLIGVALTDGTQDVMLFSDGAKAVRFDERDVRPMGRTARGVRGMRIAPGQRVISLLVADGSGTQSVLVATENGYGKRTPVAEYTRHARGTQGMLSIQPSERNGAVVSARLVSATDEIIMITTGGVLIRTRVDEIREMGRATQGVTLISLDEGERLAGVETVVESDEVDAGGPPDERPGAAEGAGGEGAGQGGDGGASAS